MVSLPPVSPPTPCMYLSSPQHSILKHPLPTFLPQWERPSFTPIQSNRQNYSSVYLNTRVGTLIVATIYLQLIQNRYMFRSFTVLHCSHQHCVKPVASDVDTFSSACCVDSSNGAVYRLKNLWTSSEANVFILGMKWKSQGLKPL